MGFNHMLLSEEARQYMGFQFPSIFVTCPRVRQTFLKKEFVMEGVEAHTLVYVDDYVRRQIKKYKKIILQMKNENSYLRTRRDNNNMRLTAEVTKRDTLEPKPS